MRKKIIIGLIYILILPNIAGQSIQDLPYDLLPWPNEIVVSKGVFGIKSNFKVTLQEEASSRVYNASTRFIRRLSDRTGVFFEKGFPQNNGDTPSLEIIYHKTGDLKLGVDESYILHINTTNIKLESATDIGVLRGLETLLQLVSVDQTQFYWPTGKIKDAPRFPWRGLMIDVARHYQPLHVLKRNFDAMAAVKLNVFHWHLTDDQGFRVESKTFPKLHQLGSDGQYYTHKEIKEIVKYAADRGIRVIPEFDVPGHATAILTAYPEIGSKDMNYEIERYAGIFDPTLDPTNEKTYEMLEVFFGEMTTLFPDEYFHIGGDENNGKHWDENENIVRFKKEKGFVTNHDLQTYFNLRIQKILEKFDKKIIGWEEIMTKNMPTSAIIHSWKGVNEGVPAGQSLVEASKRGYNAILSNGYYIDLMHNVQDHYLVDPIPEEHTLSEKERIRILGGEATMWGELVTPLTLDSRIWPRTAAIAERFWSAKNIRDLDHLKKRLGVISFRLEELGISHIKNRDVILRNIVNGYDIEPLIKLSEVCQPLKVYTRNKGGTEYKSYSPFTLFADACTTDAKGAAAFKVIVEEYVANPINGKENLQKILEGWIENNKQLLLSKVKTPLVTQLSELSSNLKTLSNFIIKMLNADSISKLDQNEFLKLLELLKQPKADVELVLDKEFIRLFDYLKTRKFSKTVNNSSSGNH